MAAYEIVFAPLVEDHLRSLKPRDRRMVLDRNEELLSYQPTQQTRNRKPMQPNPLTTWELRLGDFRVYYRVVSEPSKRLEIAAVGTKVREQIWIGGEGVDL
jgi:mRNA-degrading endonuclease RelE of RelBE toxin-antitoxin system